MSRHGYSEDGYDDAESQWATIRWNGQLKALVEALDAMPVKRLVTRKLEDGADVCALGALGRHRGIDMKPFEFDEDENDDTEFNQERLGDAFGVARQIICDVMFENDDGRHYASPEDRWEKMRRWAVSKIRPETLVPEEP